MLYVFGMLFTGCSDQGLKPCHDAIEVGIVKPSPNTIIPQGLPLDLTAKVQNLCGGELLENAIYSLSSDIEGELPGDGSFADWEYHFYSEDLLQIADHQLTLKVVSDAGSSVEDSVPIRVVANTPPQIDIVVPTIESNILSTEEGADIVAQITDEYEQLDTLPLSWTMDGNNLAQGPEFADADGVVDFSLVNIPAGCYQLGVTVVDSMNQQASDAIDLIIYGDESELNAFRWWIDADGDGYGSSIGEVIACEQPEGFLLAGQEDCDDNDPAVYPGATFDAAADECMEDADGDGYGNANSDEPFDAGTDCDDSNPDIHPGVADYCNDGLDSDCNPVTPTGCYPYGEVDATMSEAYFSGQIYEAQGVGDIDGDGYNEVAMSLQDRTLQVFTGPLLGEITADATMISDLHGGVSSFRGNLGKSIAGGYDFNGDGYGDMLLGNPDWRHACNGNYTIAVGTSYLYFGDTGFAYYELENARTEYPPFDASEVFLMYQDYLGNGCNNYYSNVGAAITFIPDMDGDGTADFAVAATINEGVSKGSVWVYLSSDVGNFDSGNMVDSGYRVELTGGTEGDELGTALASADVDGDGLSDLIVSAAAEGSQGKVYVVFGRDIPNLQASIDIRSIASLTFEGTGAGDRAGVDVAGVGDLDGDGDDEFLVTASGAEAGRGVVYVVPGFYDVNGTYKLDDAFPEALSPNAVGSVRWVGAENDQLQEAKAAGDINNDGFVDFVIGAPGHSTVAADAGAAYIVYGGPAYWGDWWLADGSPQADVYLHDAAVAEQNTAWIYSQVEGEGLGANVAPAMDVNADGIDDVLISPSTNVFGTLRIFFGGGS